MRKIKVSADKKNATRTWLLKKFLNTASISRTAGINFSLILSGINEEMPFFIKEVSIRKKHDKTTEKDAEVRNAKASRIKDAKASAFPLR